MSGGIHVEQMFRFVVHHEGSVAVVFSVDDVPETRRAARQLIDSLRQGGAPILVVVDYRTATVLSHPLEEILPREGNQ